MTANQFPVSADGAYSGSFVLGGPLFTNNGDYTVTANYDGSPITAIFYYTVAPPLGYCATTTTCSMGLTDYGITSSGSTYEYYGYTVESTTTFTKLTITGNNAIGVQLNGVVMSVPEDSELGEYWIQNVAGIIFEGGISYYIHFWNNIWNFTGENAYSPGMAGEMDGCNLTNHVWGEYYGCNGPSFITTLPFKIVLEEASSTRLVVAGCPALRQFSVSGVARHQGTRPRHL